MQKIAKVGLIGCGHIAETYFRAHKYFNNFLHLKGYTPFLCFFFPSKCSFRAFLFSSVVDIPSVGLSQ